MDWARILAYVTGTVDQELLARNEYLAAENRILKAQLNGRLTLSDANRAQTKGHDLAGLGAQPRTPSVDLAHYRARYRQRAHDLLDGALLLKVGASYLPDLV